MSARLPRRESMAPQNLIAQFPRLCRPVLRCWPRPAPIMNGEIMVRTKSTPNRRRHLKSAKRRNISCKSNIDAKPAGTVPMEILGASSSRSHFRHTPEVAGHRGEMNRTEGIFGKSFDVFSRLVLLQRPINYTIEIRAHCMR